MELFARLFDNLYKDKDHDEEYHRLRKLGIASILLHDIGHGPFSHATESIFGFKHETLSIRIIQEKMGSLLEQEDIAPKDVVSVISKATVGPEKLLSQLITSQLDVDRLDYLARDIYFTGVGFGGVDLERIMRTLTIYENSGFLEGYAVVEEKGKHSIESYSLVQ
jgi:hypothetical protein